MTDDDTTSYLVRGLRSLRKSQGETLEERLMQSGLLSCLGNGSLSRSVSTLRHLRRKYAADREGDVPAYFFTLDHRNAATTLDARLKAYARRFHVDERTALRRSDRGAVKIAEALRHGLRYDRPWGLVLVAQDESGIRCFFRGSIPTGSQWADPVVYLNDTRQRDLDLTLAPDPDNENRERFAVQLPHMELDWSAKENDAMGTLVVAWAPGLAPLWDLVSYLPDYRIYARLTVEDGLMAEVTVRRWEEADRPPNATDPLPNDRPALSEKD